MPSLVELSKAMTPNKKAALLSAMKRQRAEVRNNGKVSDRVTRDASYAHFLTDRHGRGRTVDAAYKRLDQERRTLASFDRDRRGGGGGPSVDWRHTSWADSKRRTKAQVEDQLLLAAQSKKLASGLANDQRLKPRRLP